MGITIYSIGYAQEKPVNDTILNKLINLNEVIFSANKSEEKKSDVAYNIEVIKSKDIELSNPQNSADMLSNTGNIMVQKSQGGGGSPIIRGFEANRVLIVIDGVRMNNAIYRGGHLQDVITIDNAMLDRTEIIYGPSSVMYGSDALGGVMHFYTKNPLFGINKMNFKLNSSVRYSSANQEKTGHINWSIANQKWGLLGAYTSSDFGDLRMGKTNGFSPTFGKRLSYIERFNGKDSIVKNSSKGIEKK